MRAKLMAHSAFSRCIVTICADLAAARFTRSMNFENFIWVNLDDAIGDWSLMRVD